MKLVGALKRALARSIDSKSLVYGALPPLTAQQEHEVCLREHFARHSGDACLATDYKSDLYSKCLELA